MIIRRYHTSNFTNITNTLFDDNRLSLDDMGLLAWLLSRPHDWEIRRAALMRRHRIGEKKLGRDGLRRIIRSLMKTGWCRAEKTRLSNGTFFVIYEIRDEPGPEMSEAEIVEALSLVSSEADDEETREGDISDRDQVSPDLTSGVSPEVASQRRLDAPGPIIKDLPRTEEPRTHPPNEAGAVFDEIRAVWPSSEIVSPYRCEQLFASLAPEDRVSARDGIRPYLGACRTKNRKICDLATYLREKRWETASATPARTGFVCLGGSPQAFRWLAHFEATGGHTFEVSQLRAGRPITTPTEWPPAMPYPQKSEAAE